MVKKREKKVSKPYPLKTPLFCVLSSMVIPQSSPIDPVKHSNLQFYASNRRGRSRKK